MSLPRLDFSLFLNGDESERQKLASELFASLSQHGFVRLVNHGIIDSEVNRLFQWVSLCSPPILFASWPQL